MIIIISNQHLSGCATKCDISKLNNYYKLGSTYDEMLESDWLLTSHHISLKYVSGLKYPLG